MTELELQQFRELLPFYVNHTLSETDRAFVEKCLTIQPKLQEEIDFIELLKTNIKSVSSQRTATTGLEGLLRKLDKLHPNEKINYLSKLSSLLTQQATPVFVTLSIVIAVQSFFLVSLSINKPSVSIISDSSRSFLSSPIPVQVKLTISPSANFAGIVTILQKTGTRIVNGPSENGEIWIEFSSQVHFKEMIKKFQTSPAIIDVIVIKQEFL